MRKLRFWTVFTFSFVAAAFFYGFSLQGRFRLHLLTGTSRSGPFSDTTKKIYKAENEVCSERNLMYGNYCVISLFGGAERDNLGFVTLSTQGTVEFLHHVVVLCNRWSGPISVAVYGPAEDFVESREMVDTLRDCDFCIRHWVSWHFFFQKQQIPNIQNLTSRDCRSIAQENRTAKRSSQGPYPINVGRNIARNKTHTPYVFSIDIELYPSLGILSKFERMIRFLNATSLPQVWVLPVFEVNSKFTAPRTKFQLRSMYKMNQIISFHKFRCDECHRIPNLTQWFDREANMKSEVNESLEELKVWATVKRSRKHHLHYWEPFFIGTREDPEFDIRLSWEGKQNKMQMAFEMCVRNYDFHIVENAFLVHAPGINVYNGSKEKYRLKYQRENGKWISIIKKSLIKKYGHNIDC